MAAADTSNIASVSALAAILLYSDSGRSREVYLFLLCAATSSLNAFWTNLKRRFDGAVIRGKFTVRCA